jgi:hypothetical protein
MCVGGGGGGGGGRCISWSVLAEEESQIRIKKRHFIKITINYGYLGGRDAEFAGRIPPTLALASEAEGGIIAADRGLTGCERT